MKFIDNWREASRWWSLRICAAAAALYTALLLFAEQLHDLWLSLPPEVQAIIPHREKIVPVIFLAAAIARVLRQRDPHA